jgi:uncharacterized protein YbjQ (UPF0145 family)
VILGDQLTTAGSHQRVTGFSGNEIFCLNSLGYKPGQLCLGNNVIALGVARGIGAGLSNLAGGEVEQVTDLVHQGRANAFDRMVEEAQRYGGVGLAGVTFDMIRHGGNLEFIATGSTIHRVSDRNDRIGFSTSADAQELYCQLDAGFTPRSFVFGNVAYSIGVGGSIGGAFRGLGRGEVSQYTEIFDRTRHLALSRIKEAARRVRANAVIGIETSITRLLGTQEMMMTGTASSHPLLINYADEPVTSDMTNQELWNLVNIGYLPLELVMGVSVYSLGLASGIKSWAKSLAGGSVDTLSELLYEAREKAFERIEQAAERCGADEVVGTKTRVYDLGGGLVEFMVMGTAVKRISGVTTRTASLPAQAIIVDRDTFVESDNASATQVNTRQAASAARTQGGAFTLFITIMFVVFWVYSMFFR